ncbi:hypothetical protein B0A49_03879 [Cryomyces minteri]|uniref:Uncharacterized protein n=1 Tax=Cryomyces minteri TaxID=331657 RepID=A0A4U0XJP6_9PEZI|nr:hypothetical protein B0A49_03879 [Cryomyces minteri]
MSPTDRPVGTVARPTSFLGGFRSTRCSALFHATLPTTSTNPPARAIDDEDVQADTIRTALSSTSSCSSSTVTTLQTLLGSVHKPSKIAPPPSKRALKSAITTVALNTATHRIKTVPKARSKSRVAVTVEVLEDGVIHSVAPKEKLMLATEVVNASLKTLTDALKPQPKSHRRVSSTKNNPLKIIEAILEDLELSAACSPANVVLSYAKEASTKAKAAKQLESLVQTLLSLCPSTSSTIDQAASNIKINAPPEVTLQIQSLAFQVRRLWWKLAEHHGKDETEIMEPFAKCLAAFIRRSDAPPASKYRTAAQALEPLYGSIYSSPQQWTGLPPRFTVCKIIGSLAHAARQTQDAIMWTQLMVDMCVSSAASDAKRAACIIRRTALMLEDGIPTVVSKSQVSEVPD